MLLTPTTPRLSYTLSGSGDPLLLIMGFGMRGIAWRPIAERLSASFTVCHYDHRDVGLSERSSSGYTMRDLADDARRVLDALGWKRAHIVGVSMGGMIAQELALQHPERVQTVSLIATQSGGPRAWLPPLRTVPLLLGVALGSQRLNKRLFPRILHPPERIPGVPQEVWHQRWLDAHHIPVPGRVRRLQLAAIRTHDTRSRLKDLTAPTLVVKPTQDKLCRPSRSDTLAAGLPNATLVELDAGHGLIVHAADELTDAIRAFIARQ